MGVDVIIAFNPPLSQRLRYADIRQILREFEVLDDMARAQGLTTLSTFVREDPEDGGGDAESRPEGAWLAVAAGLKTMEGLIATLADPEVVERLDEGEIVLDELKEIQRCLEIGREQSSEFRLEVW